MKKKKTLFRDEHGRDFVIRIVITFGGRQNDFISLNAL